MTMNFLDATGLAHFWAKVKAHVLQNGIFYGTCDTGGGTVAKVATVTGVTELKTGLTVAIKFTAANTVANPTLNVNSLGAKAIKRYGTTAPSTSAASSWNANSVVTLTYDGTYWQMHDWNNTTYSSMSVAEYEAGTGTSARVITPARLKAAIETWSSNLAISSDGDLDGATYTITDGNTTYPFPSSDRFTTANVGLLNYIQSLAVNGNLFPTTVTGNMYNLVLDGDDIAYDANTSVNAKIDTIISSGGEPNAINTISVNNVNQTIANKNVNIETVIIGSTSDYTPTQVKSAIDSGKNVIITYTHSTYGNIVGYSFNYSQAYNSLVSNTIAYYNNNYYLFELVGTLTNNSWSCEVTQLAESSSIPTKVSDLTNDAGYLTQHQDISGKLDKTGGQLTGDVTLYSASGNSPSIIFQRGTLTDNYNDWQIYDKGGFLYFAQRGQNSSAFEDQVYFNTSGGVYATTYNGSGANLTGVLKSSDITSSITSSSTNSQAAGAKAVYDMIGDVESLLSNI